MLPTFEAGAPRWATHGGFYHKRVDDEWPSDAWTHARTSNAIVNGEWFYDTGLRFREQFGQTGGEDSDLFHRMSKEGANFGWREAARVHETVHAEQCSVGWLFERHRRCGRNFEAVAPTRLPIVRAIKRFATATFRFVAALPGTYGAVLAWPWLAGGMGFAVGHLAVAAGMWHERARKLLALF